MLKIISFAWYDNPGYIVLFVLLGAALLALVAWLLNKYVIKRNKESNDELTRKDEQSIAEEQLSQILEPIEDEKTIKAMEEFERKDDEEKKNK